MNDQRESIYSYLDTLLSQQWVPLASRVAKQFNLSHDESLEWVRRWLADLREGTYTTFI